MFEKYVAANASRSKRTNALYRYEANRYLGDWLTRPFDLDAISRADVDARFNSITAAPTSTPGSTASPLVDHGCSAANRAMSLLRSIHRRPCVDHDGLRNPVDLWLAGGGKVHRKARRVSPRLFINSANERASSAVCPQPPSRLAPIANS